MKQNLLSQQLQMQWERALERATEAPSKEKELGTEELKDTVGLQVKTRVFAAYLGWHTFGTCDCSKTGIMCT